MSKVEVSSTVVEQDDVNYFSLFTVIFKNYIVSLLNNTKNGQNSYLQFTHNNIIIINILQLNKISQKPAKSL